MIKVGMVSLGCPKNLVDSEVMLGTLKQSGYELTPDPASADVIVVNTCTFIEPARRESIDTILEMAGHKKSGRCRRLVVAGCMVQRNHDELREAIPEIDALVGLNDIERIAEACALEAGSRFEAGRERATYLYTHASPRLLTTPRHTAYIKISEGCDHTCSFCAIPSFRGLQRSRSIESIVEEARALAGSGVVEISLIAQDTTDYGRDRSDGASLAGLLRALDAVGGIRWIRVLYAYPNRITPEFVEALGSSARAARYLDVPLQHADAAMLKTMRRGGSAETHRKLIESLRRGVPGIALRTTFIVGFPGETAQQFQALCAFAREAEFDHLGVFTYSEEKGTEAAGRPDDVPAEVKEERRMTLMAIQEGIAARRNRSLVGREIEVLVDGAPEDSDLVLCGRTEGQAPEIDGRVILTDAPGPLSAGTFVRARIDEAHPFDLVGSAVEVLPAGRPA
ncbi:MAG TPA: 30S ribosomal protein S12 methylthiotransferase RimO [Candidatus Polarisedimenticolia bacterium]|jgi:ribosomal protein S12 methylthiotransferase|nr:30S ribosomal protein S12 methylthiotransferase RimO [Candidatus Polarisedimenticolia bacterium]